MRLCQRCCIVALIVVVAALNGFTAPARSATLVSASALRPAQADLRAGLNLDDVVHSTAVIFTNVMNQAAPWTSDAALAVGADGYVQRLQPGQIAQTVTLQSALYPAGEYTLCWDGRGSLELDPRSGHVVRSAAGSATLQIAAPRGYGIRLRLTSTDPDDHLRNIRLLLPGFTASDEQHVFAPSFLSRLAPLSVLRFAHWSPGELAASSLTWMRRPTVKRFTQGGADGVALEYQIALANALGADPWFVIPAGATNLYVTQSAALVYARLDPRLRPFFEYAPGSWRSGSAANAYATMAGRNFHLAADAPSAAVRWYALRSSQIFGIVDDVFGRDAGRVTHVIGGEMAVPNSPDDRIDRAILAGIRAGRNGDVFAVDVETPTSAALAYTRSLVSASGLRLAASGAAVSAATSVPAVRADLNVWQTTGGGAFVAGAAALPALLDFVRAHPTRPAVAPTLTGAVEPAAENFAQSYVPSGAARASAQVRQIAASTNGVAINCGGGATGTWVAEEDAAGGTISHGTTATIDTSGVTNPAPEAVYQTGRYGSNFSYSIGGLTPSGTYSVRLHFSEYNYTSAGKRLGTFAINGTQVLTNFDIYKAAGGGDRAIAQAFTVSASTGGALVIAATSATNNAMLNGIEIVATNATPPPQTTDVLQFHNDAGRTGWNPKETTLNTSNVASSKFKLLQTLKVDGLVLTQPLYVSKYPVSADGGRVHNLLIVATESDTVYAFDADSGSVLWQHSIGTAQPSVEVGGDPNVGCTDIVPSYGINSTPAIDRNAGRIYVVAASEPQSGVYHTKLHALDLGSGADALPAASISASHVMTNGSTIAFEPLQNMQRASILLANGSIYLGFGSHCDYAIKAMTGWLMQYNPSNLQQISAFNTIEDSVGQGSDELGSIWGSGFGPAADAQGNIYTVTGNGAFDASASGHNYSMSVLRFSSNISAGVQDWFAYHSEADDSRRDLDFGSGGVMLLPTQANLPQQNTLVAMGKSSYMYLLDRSSLGRFTSNDSGALSIATAGTKGLWGGPAFFAAPAGPTIFYQTDSDYMRAYTLTSSGGKATLHNTQSGTTSSGYGGSMPVVSSNGTAAGSGIVWSVRRVHYANGQAATEDLDAYDATNLKNHLFAQYSGTWSKADDTEFVSPLVANGKVYVGAYKTVTVFGLTP